MDALHACVLCLLSKWPCDWLQPYTFASDLHWDGSDGSFMEQRQRWKKDEIFVLQWSKIVCF